MALAASSRPSIHNRPARHSINLHLFSPTLIHEFFILGSFKVGRSLGQGSSVINYVSSDLVGKASRRVDIGMARAAQNCFNF